MSKIKTEIIRGAFFSGLSKYSSLFISILVTAVLARLLPPDDFGIIALMTVLTCFFDILSNAGMGPAIIQNKTIKDYEIPQLFKFSIILAISLVCIFVLISKPVSSFYHEPRLEPLLNLIAIQLLFSTLNVVPNALNLKEKRFKYIAIVNISSSFICGIFSIVAAICGAGIYALIITPIGNSIIAFSANTIKCRKLIFCGAQGTLWSSLKKILNFSFYQFSFNIINFFSRNLDKMLLGKFLGMSELGLYEKSYRLMTLPISTLTNVFSPTIQPVLSEYQEKRETIRNVYNKLSIYLCAIGVVLAPFLFICADELILIAFGHQWAGAVPIFKVLALSVPFQLIDSLSGGFFQAANDVKHLFISGLLCAILNIFTLGCSLLLFDSIVYVSICVSLSLIANFFISIYYINHYSVEQSVFDFLRPLVSLFLYGIVLLIILYIEYYLISNRWLSFSIIIITSIFAGLVLFKRKGLITSIY